MISYSIIKTNLGRSFRIFIWILLVFFLSISLIGCADVIAETNVTAFSITKGSFLRLIRHTKVEHNIRRIAHIRNGQSWNMIKANRFFKNLSSSQVTHLEAIITPIELKKGKELFADKMDLRNIYILLDGTLTKMKDNEKIYTYNIGELINNPFVPDDIYNAQIKIAHNGGLSRL